MPRGLVPQPNRKFSDAKTFQQLGTMLDDYFLLLTKQVTLQYGDIAFRPKVAKALNGMRVGTLVSVNMNQTVKWADRTTPIEGDADGVIVDVLDNNNVVWAPIAEVECKVPDGLGGGARPVYLGQYGQVQATQPDSGYIQTVGNITNFDARTQLYTVMFILPGYSYTA